MKRKINSVSLNRQEYTIKKLGFVLLSSALLLTACAVRFEKSADTTASSKVTALSEDKQKMLDKATADYKTFV